MKDKLSWFGAAISIALGWNLGQWMWNGVLEDKVENFKEKLDNKRKEKGA